MRDIKAFSDIYPGCSRLYVMPTTFERLPKLVDVLYPLVADHTTKLYYTPHLNYDKTLMIDLVDLKHFQQVTKYRIEDCGGSEYVLADPETLQEFLVAGAEAHSGDIGLIGEYKGDGELFAAVGYVGNLLSYDSQIHISSTTHPLHNNQLKTIIKCLALSCTIFNFRGYVVGKTIFIESFSPHIRDYINQFSVEHCTNVMRTLLTRPF